MKTHLGNVQSCYDRGHVKLIISPFALLFSTAYSLYQIPNTQVKPSKGVKMTNDLRLFLKRKEDTIKQP